MHRGCRPAPSLWMPRAGQARRTADGGRRAARARHGGGLRAVRAGRLRLRQLLSVRNRVEDAHVHQRGDAPPLAPPHARRRRRVLLPISQAPAARVSRCRLSGQTTHPRDAPHEPPLRRACSAAAAETVADPRVHASACAEPCVWPNTCLPEATGRTSLAGCGAPSTRHTMAAAPTLPYRHLFDAIAAARACDRTHAALGQPQPAQAHPPAVPRPTSEPPARDAGAGGHGGAGSGDGHA